MKKIKITVFLTVVISIVLLMSSCEEWLDVQPKSEISTDKLFSTQSGFESALRGIYSKMSKDDSYGYDITMKMMDIFAQYYDININHSCYKIDEYKYDEPVAVEFIYNVWTGHYNKIAGCNVILDYLKRADTTMFENKKYELIKGETLGLRAFLHLDLLRMYAPSYKNGVDAKAIPYVTDFSMNLKESLTVEQTIAKIIEDFTKAEALLAVSDPILYSLNYKKYGWEANWLHSDEDDSFLKYRGQRMNYYAVHGLMARTYMLKNDYVNARKHLEIVLGEDAPFELSHDKSDPISVSEIVFGLSSGRKVMESRFNESSLKVIGIQNYLVVNNNVFETIYDDIDDHRRMDFLGSNETGQIISLKYSDYKEYGGKTPLLKLPELRYYLAEAIFDTDKTRAIGLLEEYLISKGVRSSIDQDISRAEFMEFIVKDARKEFLQEGQLFFFCKRLGLKIKKEDTKLDMLDKYVFPMPDKEVQFGNR